MSYFRHAPQQPGEPLLFTLSRSDDSVVADFFLGDLKKTMRTMEAAAWRDHRERTLRPVEVGETGP